jgi:hypothetical protein
LIIEKTKIPKDMKSKVALLSLVSLLFTFASVAQEIENDDMYFNSKDRAKLNAAKASQASYTASIKKTKKEVVEEEEETAANPTDSYSARNVNPEYEARTNSETAQADNEDYFVNNYQYNNASKFNNWNNNFNRWYSNPWYGGNYYDPFISSWNSPYYGSYYDTWGSPWGNPYYRSGWSSSFSYHWGSSWNYGWGMNFGFGNQYYNPYNAWGWSPYGYSPWGHSYYGGWGYPTQVVIVESGNRYGPAYGKRGSRSSEVGREYVNSRSGRSSNRGDLANPDTNRPNTGGRVGTTTSRQSDYYNRSWRNQSQNSPSYDNSGSGNNRSSWENNTRSSWQNSNSGGSSRTYDGGRSSTGSSSSGSQSGGGSSSGSRSSGRGH